jgi:E3 ubiquitin-protein ligase MARCH6
MIVVPGAVFRSMQYLLPSLRVDDKFVCKHSLSLHCICYVLILFLVLHVYPGIFMSAGLVRSTVILYSMLSKWSQSIRDKEFLVEMRLRNHEPEKVNMKGGNPNDVPTNGIVEGRAVEG